MESKIKTKQKIPIMFCVYRGVLLGLLIVIFFTIIKPTPSAYIAGLTGLGLALMLDGSRNGIGHIVCWLILQAIAIFTFSIYIFLGTI